MEIQSKLRGCYQFEKSCLFRKKLWYCVGREVKHKNLDFSTELIYKLANARKLKADFSCVSRSSIHSDEGLTLETSTFNFLTVANLLISIHLINPNFCVGNSSFFNSEWFLESENLKGRLLIAWTKPSLNWHGQAKCLSLVCPKPCLKGTNHRPNKLLAS